MDGNLFPAFVVINGVQQFVRFLSAGLTQKILIKLNDVRIFVRFPYSFVFVFSVDGISSLSENFAVPVVIGLASTRNAPTDTSHDFYGVIIGFTCSDIVQQFSGIRQTMSNADIQR